MRLVLAVLVATAAGCGTRPSNVSVEVLNAGEAPVLVWLYKAGGNVEAHLMSPGTYAAVTPAARGGDRHDSLPAVELPPGEITAIGPVRGRFDGRNEPVLAVFGDARTLLEMASEPRRSLTVSRVPLGPGENHVVIESAVPTRAARTSLDQFQAAARTRGG